MGDIRKKHKRYARPRKAFDIKRIHEENDIVKMYGLKNKREIWRSEMAIKIIRDNAKKIITADEDIKAKFVENLVSQGFKVSTIGDVLSLTKENWLQRRLQTVLVEKKAARTAKEARQLIVHKHVLVNGKKVNIPSYRIGISEEDKIQVIRPTIEMRKAEAKDE